MVSPLHRGQVDEVRKCYLTSLQFYGLCDQSGWYEIVQEAMRQTVRCPSSVDYRESGSGQQTPPQVSQQ